MHRVSRLGCTTWLADRTPSPVVVAVCLALALACACSEEPAAATDTAGATDAGALGDAADTAADSAEQDAAADALLPDPDAWGKNKVRPQEKRPAAKGPLEAGVAVRYLDGPVGVSMAGYGGRFGGRQTAWNDVLNGSAGLVGMQTVKALVLVTGGEALALVKSPLMSSESAISNAIIHHLKADHGLDWSGRVITMAGHSHHTTARYWPLPNALGSVGADSFDAEVTEGIARVFADAIAAAWKDRVPAEWGHADQDGWDPQDLVYRDRRGENNPKWGKDPRLSLLAVRRKSDQAPMALLIHFPLHGTVFGGDNDLLTEDAPGAVETKFEEHHFARTGKPIVALYAQSAGGDASPAGDSLGHPGLARLEKLGEDAAPLIDKLYQGMQYKADIELAVRTERIELVHDRMYAGDPLAGEFSDHQKDPYTWGGWQCSSSGVEAGQSKKGKAKLCTAVGALVAALGENVPHGAAHQALITTARIGDVWLTTMPGEPTWSIVQYAREAAAAKQWNGKPRKLMVLGYAQDHFLYLAAEDDWFLGGYEAEMSLWGPLGGRFFADRGLSLIDDMAAGHNGPVFHEEWPSLEPMPPHTPRPIERSLKAGQIALQPAAQMARTATVSLDATCGDPALGTPRVRVERKDGAAFVPVAARTGWPLADYDNSRYDFITIYDPTPANLKHAFEAEREHLWHFYWQVPADWPLGTYRLHLTCRGLVKEGAAKDAQLFTLDSTPFAVDPAKDATLTAIAEGETVALALRVPGLAQGTTGSSVKGAKGKWPIGGYRLLDRKQAHNALALVRAPLSVELLGEGGKVLATVTAAFDAEKDRAVAKVPAGAVVVAVRAGLQGDPPTSWVKVSVSAK